MSVTYTATLPVSEDTVLFVSGLLHAERRRLGTRAGTRSLGCYRQAILVLRWLSSSQTKIICGSRRVTSVDVLSRIAIGLCMSSRARVALLLGDRDHESAPWSVAAPEHALSHTPGEDVLSERFSDLTAI